MRHLSQWFDRLIQSAKRVSSERLVASTAIAIVAWATWALSTDSRQKSIADDMRPEVGIAQKLDLAVVDEPFSKSAFVPALGPEDNQAADPTPLSLGDQVKITIFERLEALGQPKGGTSAPVGLVEQTTLTGDYAVQQSGHVVMPMLGAFSAADDSIDHLTREIRKAYIAVFRQDAKVSISIVDRRPIYVLGVGSKAGTFKFSPGMTVLHALALVGGADDERRDVYLQSELVRQRERHANALRLLQKAQVRAVVLRAERDGNSPQPTPSLTRIAGAKRASELIQAELKIRKLIGDLKKSQIDAARSTIATAQQEIAEINTKVTILNAHIGVKKLRKEALSKLTDTRSANPFLSNQVSGEVFDIEERRQEVLLSLSEAKRKLDRAETDRSRLLTEQTLELEKEIAVVEQEVTEQEGAVSSSERLIQELRMQDARVSLESEATKFEIVRQTVSGPQRLSAHEMTELKAGDLIQVKSSRPL